MHMGVVCACGVLQLSGDDSNSLSMFGGLGFGFDDEEEKVVAPLTASKAEEAFLERSGYVGTDGTPSLQAQEGRAPLLLFVTACRV